MHKGVSPLGSRRSILPARPGAIALITTLFAAGTALVTAAPAQASTYTLIQSGSWSSIDSALPKTSFVNPRGDAPIGAHTYADGTNHVSKSYFTFDLSSLSGARVLGAEMFTSETVVADCSVPRGTEIWVTAPAKKAPTWAAQPAELSKLPGPGSLNVCPSNYLDWDAAPALRDALAADRKSVTFVLRLPDTQQNDPRYGRSYQPSLQISVEKNHAPAKPAQLSTQGKPCEAKPLVGSGETRLSAIVTDPDDALVGAEFAWWPAGHPDQRATWDTGNYWSSGYPLWFDVGPKLADGVTYAWQVRGKDDLDAGPWSQVCKFGTDFVRPDKAPTVTSTDFTAQGTEGPGGTGIPGMFTFGANGVGDVATYYYGFNGETYIPVTPSRPGGPASISYTPDRSGPQWIYVRSADAAGNVSFDRTVYDFFVPGNQPTATCTPDQAYLGEPRQCTIRARGNGGAKAFVYRLDDGVETTEPTSADGTATVTVTPSDPGVYYPQLIARTRLDNGNLTAPGTSRVATDRGVPGIDTPQDAMVGKPASFTFHAVLPGSVSFTYRWDGGEQVTVPAGPDGTATVTITPRNAYYRTMEVFSATEAGLQSGTASDSVNVASNQPLVTSRDYPENGYGGGATIPGTFTFSSPVANVVSYTYTFNDDAPVTVPAGGDGTARVTLTPLHAYSQTLLVTSTFADGSVSEQRRYSFLANSMAPQMSCDNTGAVHPGQLVRCTFSTAQPGVAAYHYVSDVQPEVTVPVAADGTGAMSFTVPADQTSWSIDLRVWSVNGAGLATDPLSVSFYVDFGSGAARAV